MRDSFEGFSVIPQASLTPGVGVFPRCLSAHHNRLAGVSVPVGAQLVVARTRDGGESFEVLRSGLPQEGAYDLVYRHGLDVDSTGERLAMGSTTGGLWVSEDQGDRWSCLSAHLPPIRAVRFAGPPS